MDRFHWISYFRKDFILLDDINQNNLIQKQEIFDGFSCFHNIEVIDIKDILSFLPVTHQNTPLDPTVFQFKITLAQLRHNTSTNNNNNNNNNEKKEFGNILSADLLLKPVLLFHFDNMIYLVNHTNIKRVDPPSLPTSAFKNKRGKKENNKNEMNIENNEDYIPSYLLYFEHFKLRFWIDTNYAVYTAVSKLTSTWEAINKNMQSSSEHECFTCGNLPIWKYNMTNDNIISYELIKYRLYDLYNKKIDDIYESGMTDEMILQQNEWIKNITVYLEDVHIKIIQYINNENNINIKEILLSFFINIINSLSIYCDRNEYELSTSLHNIDLIESYLDILQPFIISSLLYINKIDTLLFNNYMKNSIAHTAINENITLPELIGLPDPQFINNTFLKNNNQFESTHISNIQYNSLLSDIEILHSIKRLDCIPKKIYGVYIYVFQQLKDLFENRLESMNTPSYKRKQDYYQCLDYILSLFRFFNSIQY